MLITNVLLHVTLRSPSLFCLIVVCQTWKVKKSENSVAKIFHISKAYLSPCFLTLTHIQEYGHKVHALVFWRCLDCIWPTHTGTNTHRETHAMCASMWRCLDGVGAAYLSVCDRLTAQAPSTLSTIITSRSTHINTYTRTCNPRSDHFKKGPQWPL